MALLAPPGERRYLRDTNRQANEFYKWLLGSPEMLPSLYDRLREYGVVDPDELKKEAQLKQLLQIADKFKKSDDPKIQGQGYMLYGLAVSEQGKALYELGMEVEGEMGVVVDREVNPDGGRWVRSFFTSFANTIAGGTSEIQRNIIAERVLGLPRGGG